MAEFREEETLLPKNSKKNEYYETFGSSSNRSLSKNIFIAFKHRDLPEKWDLLAKNSHFSQERAEEENMHKR